MSGKNIAAEGAFYVVFYGLSAVFFWYLTHWLFSASFFGIPGHSDGTARALAWAMAVSFALRGVVRFVERIRKESPDARP